MISQYKILIVEDENKEIDYIKWSLINLGIVVSNIIVTDNTSEAMALIQIHEPDIIFADANLTGTENGKGDGFLMLVEINDKYKENNFYKPFTVAISSYLSFKTKKKIAKYSSMQIAKHEKNYPSIALNRFFLSKESSFIVKKTNVNDTEYMQRVTKLIHDELCNYNFNKIKEEHKNYITDFIISILPTVEKRNYKADEFYKEIAIKYNKKQSVIKTVINRCFSDTFTKINNFHDIYLGNENKPKTKEFYAYIAEEVMNKLK